MSSNPFKTRSKDTTQRQAHDDKRRNDGVNNFKSAKGKSAFSKRDKPNVVESYTDGRNAFKNSNYRKKTVVKIKSYNSENEYFPSLKNENDVASENTEHVTTPTTINNNDIKFNQLFIGGDDGSTNIRELSEAECIKPGWLVVKKDGTRMKNAQYQAYDDYLERMENPDNDYEDPPLLLPQQEEQHDFDELMHRVKYERVFRKLTNLYEMYCEEDALRGYPHDVETVYSWEIDRYYERLTWEEKWEQMEDDAMNDYSDDDEEETDASDLEY